LEQHRSIGTHAEPQQVGLDARGAAGNLARRIDVFDAQQPPPTRGLGLRVAGHGGKQ
jgi:hypothetical protein